MTFQPFMFIGDIQAFEKEGADHLLTRLRGIAASGSICTIGASLRGSATEPASTIHSRYATAWPEPEIRTSSSRS